MIRHKKLLLRNTDENLWIYETSSFQIPKEIINQYNLNNMVSPNGWVYIDIRKVIPGLQQVCRISNDILTSHLANFGYSPTRLTPGLWKHESRLITFSLVVDDFGVKYVGKKHSNHLLASLHQLYTVTQNWTGSLFSGMILEWNYIEKCVHFSMPGYIPAMLHRFQHRIPFQYQDAPHAWTKPTYGAKLNYAPDTDNSPVLSATKIRHI